MSRQDTESVLRPWMERQGRVAPDGLLRRVMTEVRTMPQESTPWRLRLTSFSLGWAVTAAVVVALVVGLAVLFETRPSAAPVASPTPTASPTPPTPPTSISASSGERVSDPIGDGTPDFVAVTTSLVNDEVVFDFEFASDHGLGDSFLTIFIPSLDVLDQTDCSAYTTEYLIQMPALGRMDSAPGLSVPDPGREGGWSEATPLDYTLAGGQLTIRVPLGLIGNPEVLHFSADVYNIESGIEGLDRLPDWDPLLWPNRPTPCVNVALLTASPSATPPGDVSAIGGEQVSDPIGDGTPDFVAVTTSLVDGEVAFDFEFASDFDPAQAVLSLMIPMERTLREVGCNGYFTEYLIQMPALGRMDSAPGLSVPDSTSQYGWTAVPIPLTYSLVGPRLTIRIPVRLIGSPEVLHYWAQVYRFTSEVRRIDDIPDQPSENPPFPCIETTLVAASPSP